MNAQHTSIPLAPEHTPVMEHIAPEGAAYTYQRADGTVEHAANAAEAFAQCPFLGKLALESPDMAAKLLELAARGREIMDSRPTESDTSSKLSELKIQTPKKPSVELLPPVETAVQPPTSLMRKAHHIPYAKQPDATPDAAKIASEIPELKPMVHIPTPQSRHKHAGAPLIKEPPKKTSDRAETPPEKPELSIPTPVAVESRQATERPKRASEFAPLPSIKAEAPIETTYLPSSDSLSSTAIAQTEAEIMATDVISFTEHVHLPLDESPFETFLATYETDHSKEIPATLPALQEVIIEDGDQPLEVTLIQLSKIIEQPVEITSLELSQTISEIAAILPDCYVGSDEIAQPTLTPAIETKLHRLLRLVGYQEPHRVVQQCLEGRSLGFLLQSLEHLCKHHNDGMRPLVRAATDMHTYRLYLGKILSQLAMRPFRVTAFQ